MKKTACEFKSSFKSTKSFFVQKGFIDFYQNILNLNGFRKANAYWSKRAQERYGVEGMLFTEITKRGVNDKVYHQASPNMDAFHMIDEKKKPIDNQTKLNLYAPTSLEQGFTSLLKPGEEFTTVHKILKQIADSVHTLAPLAEELLKRPMIKLNVRFNAEGDDIPITRNGEAIAWYDPNKKIIIVNKNGKTRRSIEEVLLHEIIHYYTLNYIKDDGFFTIEFREIWDYAKANTAKPDLYGYTSLTEFISEVFTNKTLINDLASLPPIKQRNKYSNLFAELWDTILKALNLNNESLYSQAFTLGSQLLNEAYLYETVGEEIVNSEEYQVSPESEEPPDVELDKRITRFLTSIGVQINSLDEIKVRDTKGNLMSITAKSSLLQGIIDIANNKRGLDTLTEEAAHFLVELLGDSHPLVKQMIESIDQFDIYKKTVEEYGELETYKGDDKKLRKEAVGKLITQIAVKQYKDTVKGGRFIRLFNALIDWIKAKLGGAKVSPVSEAIVAYEQAAKMLITNDTSQIMTMENYRKINEGKPEQVMYQVNPEDDVKRKEILEQLQKTSVVKDKQGYKLVTTGERVKRVTDTVKKVYYEIFRKFDRLDNRSKQMATMGTLLHSALQHIVLMKTEGTKVTKDALIKRVTEDLRSSDDFNDLPDTYFAQNLDTTVVNILVKTVNTVIQTINEKEEMIRKQTGMTKEEWEARKPILIPEKTVYNALTKTAGTVDLMVIHSNGAISIFDWKNMKFTTHNGEIIAEVDQSKRFGFDAQMLQYKNIIQEEYGTSNFGMIRIVPLNLQLDSKGNIYRLQSFNKDNTSTYLEHIPSAAETTGIEELDRSLETWIIQRTNLQKAYLKNKKLKMLIPKIQKLDQMIRTAQVTREFGIVNQAIDDLMERFKKQEVWNQDTSQMLADLIEEVDLYKSFINSGVKYLNTVSINHNDYSTDKAYQTAVKKHEEKQELYADSLAKITRLEGAIQNKIAEVFIVNKTPESRSRWFTGRSVNWFTKIFKRLSEYDRGAFQELFKLVNSGYEWAKQQVESDVELLTHAVENLGMPATEAYKKLYNSLTGNLYVRTSSKFYKDRKKAAEEKDIQWFLDNTELEVRETEDGNHIFRYKGKGLEAYNKARKGYEKSLRENSTFSFKTEKEKDEYIKRMMLEFDKKNNISMASSSIFEFSHKYLYYNNNGKYDSKEWLEIQNNPGLKQYYDTYLAIIKKLNGLVGVELDDNFVANIHRSLLENATFAGGFGVEAIKENLLHIISTRQSNDEFGGYLTIEHDAEGKPIKRVPHLYTDSLRVELSSKELQEVTAKVNERFEKNNWSKEGVDYELAIRNAVDREEEAKGLKYKSIDLTRSLILLAHASYIHSSFVQSEGAMKMLRYSLESEEQMTYRTDWKGSTKPDKISGIVRPQKGVLESEKEAFDQFADMHWYGNKGMGADFTVKVGNRNYSATKAANVFLRGTSLSAMALKPILAFSNLIGGKLNAWMKAAEGIHFTSAQLKDAQLMEAKRNAMYAASVKFWEPSSHDLTLEKANKLSATKLTSWFTISNAYILHRKGTDSVSNNVLVSMLLNYGLDSEGKITRLVKLPKGSKSLFEMQELTDNGLTIPGLKQQEYEKFRAIVRNQMTEIMGEMSEADVNLANSTMVLRYLMQFRNWMPGLIKARYGTFTYNSVTEEFDVGKFRVLWGEFSQDHFAPKFEEFKNLVLEIFFLRNPQANKENSEYFYNKYLMENRLTHKELTFDDFVELRSAKLRGVVREIQLYLALILAMLAAKAMIPDDKDDPMRQYAVILYRMVARSYLEIGFFLDPSAFKQVLKGVVPQLTFVTRVERLIRSVFEESYYIFAEDNRKKPKPKPPIYHLMKLTPGTSGLIIDLMDTFDTYKVNSGYIY